MITVTVLLDWYRQALKEAADLVGLPEYENKMVEARRYKALSETVEAKDILTTYWKNQAIGQDDQIKFLLKAVELRKTDNGTQAAAANVRQVQSN